MEIDSLFNFVLLKHLAAPGWSGGSLHSLATPLQGFNMGTKQGHALHLGLHNTFCAEWIKTSLVSACENCHPPLLGEI